MKIKKRNAEIFLKKWHQNVQRGIADKVLKMAEKQKRIGTNLKNKKER